MVDGAAIVHHHVYKCAGTTFAWVLQRNYPSLVLHVEGRAHDQRITSAQVVPYLIAGVPYRNERDGGIWSVLRGRRKPKAFKAVSSHLLAIPSPDQAFGRLHVSFIRDPIARLLSAFKFQKSLGEIAGELGFREFFELTIGHNANFQTRHSSLQTGVGPHDGRGWLLRSDTIDLSRDDLFFGTLEQFDESMVVLEQRMRDLGEPFDATYPRVMNRAAPGSTAPAEIDPDTRRAVEDSNAEDLALLDRVASLLMQRYRAIDPDGQKLYAYRQRCAALANEPWIGEVRVPSAPDWIFIDPDPAE